MTATKTSNNGAATKTPVAPNVSFGKRVGFCLPVIAPASLVTERDGTSFLSVETGKKGETKRTEHKVTVVREVTYRGVPWVVAFTEGDIDRIKEAIAKLGADDEVSF